jgi:hypothetical protein
MVRESSFKQIIDNRNRLEKIVDVLNDIEVNLFEFIFYFIELRDFCREINFKVILLVLTLLRQLVTLIGLLD